MEARIKIVDNVVPDYLFNRFQQQVLSDQFPWCFGRTAVGQSADNLYLTGWVHVVYFNNTWRTDIKYTKLFQDIIHQVLKDLGGKVLLRSRLILNTVSDQNYVFGPHVDLDKPHKTALLYVDNADGATEIYNEIYDIESTLDSVKYADQILHNNFTMLDQITPVANRAVYFNGTNYHSGQTPCKTVRRVVLNINYE